MRFEARIPADLGRRITYLMLFRLVLITLVLGVTLLINLASPTQLALPHAVILFAIIALTYGLTIVYALVLPRTKNPLALHSFQMGADLVVTTAMVHVTGGIESAYTFFYPLTILGTALIRHRRGAMVVALLCIASFTLIAFLGWQRWLPSPSGLPLAPWKLDTVTFARKLFLNAGAFAAVAALATILGEQLAQSKEQLASEVERTADLAAINEGIVRCLSSGLLTINKSGNVLVFNDAAASILGVARDDALRTPLGQLCPELEATIAQLGDREPLTRGEILVRQDGGKGLPLGVSISPLTDHSNEPIGRVVNFQDLTNLHKMEEQVARARRLAMLGQIATGVAHEIRNPLASISGAIELLKGSVAAGDENGALMQIVIREVERLDELISALLAYARPARRVPVPMSLEGLVRETVQVFAHEKTAAGAGVQLSVATADSVDTHVVADPAQIRQVVWNLLRNAKEASPSGGTVEVTLDRLNLDGRAWVQLCVTDSGPGIPAEDQERIFELFFTTKARGTGLGLATVQRIVDEHDGTISVTTAPDRGAHFVVRLPAAAPTVSPPTDPC